MDAQEHAIEHRLTESASFKLAGPSSARLSVLFSFSVSTYSQLLSVLVSFWLSCHSLPFSHHLLTDSVALCLSISGSPLPASIPYLFSSTPPIVISPPSEGRDHFLPLSRVKFLYHIYISALSTVCNLEKPRVFVLDSVLDRKY